MRDAQESIELVVCRHEGGAAFMAEAYGRLTGRPGVCLVTRGPGATNASIGVFSAAQEGVPMILIVGQVAQQHRGRGAFQELDVSNFFGGIAKWVTEIDHASRMSELISRAFIESTSGRPGPVVLSIPENVQHELVAYSPAPRIQPVRANVGQADTKKLENLIASAQRPLIVLGGSTWSEPATRSLSDFAHRFGIPVTTTFRKQDLIDSEHPQYIGSLGPGASPHLITTLQSADLLLLIGAVLGEVETAGYSRLDVPAPRQKIVQIGPDASFLNVPYHTELAIASSIDGFIQSLSELTTPSVIPWRESGAQARANHLMFREPLKTNDAINMGEFWSTLANRIPTDTVISMGAGNYTHWVLRHFRFKQLGTLLAPICAPMGYAVPAALAASRQNPSRLVIAVSGDGCFLMNSQELAVAAHFNANIIYLVVNNNMYGSVRMHQEQRFPERPYATDLTNPDFSALAVAYGIPSTKVDSQPELDSAFSCMVKDASVPRLIEIMTPPDQITPSATLSDIRKSARS